jgi:hypothetical protein
MPQTQRLPLQQPAAVNARRKVGLVWSVVLAPLHLLEQSRGWKRLVAVGALLVLLTAMIVLGWREATLRGLPKIDEPFDVKAYGTIAIPDAQNAFVLYRNASERLRELDGNTLQKIGRRSVGTNWATAAPEIRQWAGQNREPVALLVEASDRSDAVLWQPKDLRFTTPVDAAWRLRTLADLALLEGSRREQAGDLEGAWRMYRAVLRTSRLVGRHGATIQRLVGHEILQLAVPRVSSWTQNPRMTVPWLRHAMQDVADAVALTPPFSDVVRAEYFSVRAQLEESPLDRLPDEQMDGIDTTVWYSHITPARWAVQFWKHEPERSRRLLRLITAGCLAQCDRPPGERARLVDPNFMIYAQDPATPPALRSLSPQELRAWLDTSVLRYIYPAGNISSRTDREPFILANLRLDMAERWYRLDHGTSPKSYGVLVGKYIDAWPETISPGDPVAPPVEPDEQP